MHMKTVCCMHINSGWACANWEGWCKQSGDSCKQSSKQSGDSCKQSSKHRFGAFKNIRFFVGFWAKQQFVDLLVP